MEALRSATSYFDREIAALEARRNELFTLLVALNANTGERTPEVRDKLEARLSKLSFDRCLAEPVREPPPESGQS